MTKDIQQLHTLSRLMAPHNLQSDLADQLGVSQPMISQLFAGKVNMGGPLKRLVSRLIAELEHQRTQQRTQQRT